MVDQIRGLVGVMGADAYQSRDFDSHSTQALHIANDSGGGWPFSDVDTHLARRIVAGEYIGRHEGPFDDSDQPSGPARYAGPTAMVIALFNRRRLRQQRRRMRDERQANTDAVRRSQP